MGGKSRWIGTVCAAWLIAVPAGPAPGAEPRTSEVEAGIELNAVTEQLEQARQQEQSIAGELTALEQEAEAVSRRLAETASRIQSREAMITAGEDELERLDREERDLLDALKRRRAALAELLAGRRPCRARRAARPQACAARSDARPAGGRAAACPRARREIQVAAAAALWPFQGAAKGG